ncbi:MAG: threonine/serine dehydratase [Myxococcota bacterium]
MATHPVPDAMTAADVDAAAVRLEGRVVRTPVVHTERLDARVGCEVWLKCENLQRIGAFKARGALHCVGRLDPAARARGIITYSSGNHAQAVALAAREHGVTARIAMPEDAPEVKVAGVEALGAEIVFAGFTSEDRRQAAMRIQEETGGVVIPPFDHPDIIAGQGTATRELLDDAPPLDALLVPVGGGGLLAGACLVAAARSVRRIYTVEPIGCDAMAQSLEAGARVAVEPAPTLGDGLKPVMVGALNFAIARRYVTGSFRVDDAEMGDALRVLMATTKLLVEPSAAAALVPLLRGELSDCRRVGVLLSGGNVDLGRVHALLA